MMKKGLMAVITLLVMTIGVNAQVEDHALGLRSGGGNYGSGFEVSYQHGLGDVNRLEVDFGWTSTNTVSHMKFTGIYQWVYQLDGALNWYAGPGGQFVLATRSGNSASAIGIGGNIGVEYNFNEHDVPLLISLDTRPMLHFGNDYFDTFGWGIALGIRYTF